MLIDFSERKFSEKPRLFKIDKEWFIVSEHKETEFDKYRIVSRAYTPELAYKRWKFDYFLYDARKTVKSIEQNIGSAQTFA